MSIPENPEQQIRSRPPSRWFQRMAANLGLLPGESPRELIERAVEDHANGGGGFSPQERTMLLNTLRFGALRVSDVMVPRAEVIAIESEASITALLRLFAEAGHSRIPIYRESLDDPLGMVHIKDLMTWMTQQAAAPRESTTPHNPANDEMQLPVNLNGSADRTSEELQLQCVDMSATVSSIGIMREVLFVPPSMPVVDLLLRMQSEHIHLALVVDEFGGTDGLVSIEDLVEEIVGNIEDEHDYDDIPPIRRDAHGLIASARTPIENIERDLGVSLCDPGSVEELDTLGGLLFAMAGRVPPRGEVIRHPAGVAFEILDASPRRINKVRIVSCPDGGGTGVKLLEDLRQQAPGETGGASPKEPSTPETSRTAHSAEAA